MQVEEFGRLLLRFHVDCVKSPLKHIVVCLEGCYWFEDDIHAILLHLGNGKPIQFGFKSKSKGLKCLGAYHRVFYFSLSYLEFCLKNLT